MVRGTDSVLALLRAHARGLDIARLINFYDPATDRVRFDATRRELVASLKAEGFARVVFGDIHLADVRAWHPGVVRESGPRRGARAGRADLGRAPARVRSPSS